MEFFVKISYECVGRLDIIVNNNLYKGCYLYLMMVEDSEVRD